jgi:hypothetical protein
MNRVLLSAGGLLSFSMAIFKIAMPHLFHWREALGSSAAGMWAILYAENLAIAMLLLFFAYMSIFQWQELLKTSLGKTVLLSIGSLWTLRTVAELVLFKVGVDGAWWRVFLFLALAIVYLVPLATVTWTNRKEWKAQVT